MDLDGTQDECKPRPRKKELCISAQVVNTHTQTQAHRHTLTAKQTHKYCSIQTGADDTSTQQVNLHEYGLVFVSVFGFLRWQYTDKNGESLINTI